MLEPAEDHSLSIATLLDPNVLLTSHDGQSAGHYAIDGTVAVPSLVGITGSFDYSEDFVGLLVQKTWMASASATVEWALCPTSKQSDDDFFEVLELAPNTSNPAAAFTTWNKWYPEVADDPCAGGGRGYRTVAVAFDPTSGTDLLAVSRTGIPNGVALYRASRIMNAANDPSATPGSDLAVNPIGHLLTHENSTTPPFAARRSTFFEWNDGQDDRLTLVIAAGVQKCTDPPTCTNATHAKLVFFHLDDCRKTGTTCDVATNPSTCLPADASLRRVALSSVPESNAFGVTVGEIDGTQFAFSAETSGARRRLDLTNLFASTAQPPLAEAGRWNMSDSVLDGAPVPCTDVLFREEEDAQGSPIHVLYVAANRRGIVRLQVIDQGPTATPRIDFLELETINTPGQPSGLSLVNPVLSGANVPGLIVADHGGNGIKLYVAE
jgi:hypothetical protein